MFDIEEELKKLPGKPGVYIMHDKNDNIIYVGKAISLKNRVRQYFQTSRKRTAKISSMVNNISYFEYIVTDSEVEALILECNLIKEHSPKYNTMLKDGKSYPYIKITVNDEYPRVLFARQMKKDKAKYFGPYTNVTAVKDTLELVKKIFAIRTCNKSLPKEIGKGRPCLNYHIKQCEAPCMGYISKDDYRKKINQVIDLLNGNYDNVYNMLEEKMKNAAIKLEFEEAAKYRDIIESLKHIVQKQKINSSTEQDDKDVIACAFDKEDAVVQVFFIRNGKMIGREHFHMSVRESYVPEEDIDIINNETSVIRGHILNNFIKQYYSGTPFLPRNILLQEKIDEIDAICKWLTAKKGQKVYLTVPQKGQKEKLVELAEQNANIVLRQDRDNIKRQEQKTIGAVKEIEQLLGLSDIVRIESYDISNISGFMSVGSMVVYENGRPKKNDYRKFKIKSVNGPNDYACMEEVLTRRFKHGLSEEEELKNEGIDIKYGAFTGYPDIILMDGGKGQVNIAKNVLDTLKFNIPVCGMVKDDNHRTRGLYYNDVEIPIEKSSEGFKLITRIQDETHRFAIEFHRNLRAKGQIHSVLDEIKGVGNSRRKALMQYFKSIDEIKSASVEQLNKVPSIDKKTAQQIYDFFNK